MAWQGPSPRSAAISSPAATARWRSPAFLTASTGSAARRLGCRMVLAQGGVKQIIELQLVSEEQAKFSQSIAVIKANIARLP